MTSAQGWLLLALIAFIGSYSLDKTRETPAMVRLGLFCLSFLWLFAWVIDALFNGKELT